MFPHPMAVLVDQPNVTSPLLDEIDRRKIPVDRLDLLAHAYDPAEVRALHSLVINLLTPATFARNGLKGLLYSLGYLANLERLGVPVVNGLSAFTYATSKARQLTLLQSLGLPYPRAVVVNHPSQAPLVADTLRFPILLKPNIGPSVRFESPDDLARAISENALDLGLDETALVQEYIPARGDVTIRLVTLGGRFLYGVRIRGTETEPFTPPDHLLATGELIVQTAGIDAGAVEYRIDDRDGGLVYVTLRTGLPPAEPPGGLGFDPIVRYVDFLERVARAGRVVRPDTVRSLVFPDAEYWGPEL